VIAIKTNIMKDNFQPKKKLQLSFTNLSRLEYLVLVRNNAIDMYADRFKRNGLSYKPPENSIYAHAHMRT